MIEVEHLTKRYAGTEAVRGISFRVEPGEIVGFLGPNGAGKTSTMRMLAGFLPPTMGRIRIAGFDVLTESLEARRRIGYMPENVPLYVDMRVNEFLAFRAELKGLRGRRVKERVAAVKQLCGLSDMGKRMIGTLSKGYRQRVGLADALVHEPDLLILDEPTIGFDPNQIRQVRELIKSLGSRHTILLSTHLLPEVEMTCSRVLIIHRGKIEASDTPENLKRRAHAGGGVRLEVKAEAGPLRERLTGLEAVEDVTVQACNGADGWMVVEIFAKRGEDLRERVYATVSEARWPVRELTQLRATLEDVFVEITHEDIV